MNAVETHDLTVMYDNTTALKNVSLAVEQGELAAIIGPNGGGKSTLLKVLLGLARPTSGSFSLFGGVQNEVIGYVPQFAGMNKRFPISVGEAVMTSRMKGKKFHPFFRYKKEDKEAAYAVLERVGAAELFDRQISELSGGQFQRMLIARALATEPRLLLLDEPTASVDPESTAGIYELLQSLSGKMTILLVTHDVTAVAGFASKVARLNTELQYYGPPTENMKCWEVCCHA